MTDSASARAARRLQQLERRRDLLERLIFIAGSLETLRQGLENLVELTGEPQPLAHINTFEALDPKLQALESPDIQLRLSQLDRELQAQSSQVRTLLESLEDPRLDQQASLEQARSLIESFHRCARTALTLRSLLRHRGQAVDELQLPYERETLLRQLKGLATQEQAARQQVVEEIEALALALDRLLANAGLQPTMQALLGQLRAGLTENLSHLLNGGSIEHLPLAVESIEFQPVQTSIDLPLPEVAELPQPPNAAAEAPATHDQAVPTEPSPEGGFWKRCQLWISSPWHVRWKDIPKDKKP